MKLEDVPPVAQRRRIVEMDRLRAIATLAVIAIHTTTEILQHNTLQGAAWGTLAVNQAARFAVPAFLFLSGLGLALPGKDLGYVEFLRKRLGRILPLYVVWTLVYCLLPGHVTHGPRTTMAGAALALLCGTAWFHLYFVPLIVQFYVAFPLIRGCFATRRGLLACIAISLGLMCLGYYGRPSAPVRAVWDQWVFVPWLAFFAMGVWAARRVEVISAFCRRHRPLLAAAFLAGLACLLVDAWLALHVWGKNMEEAQITLRPVVMPFSIVAMAYFWGAARQPGRFLSLISSHSYGMYLAHALFLLLISKWLDRHAHGGAQLAYALVGTVFVTIASLPTAMGVDALFQRLSSPNAPRARPA